MLPDAVLSSQVVPAVFQAPRQITREPLIDYDLGGIALQDTSQGLQAKVWRAEVIGDDVVLQSEGVSPIVIFTQAGITEIALTFDQLMQPFIAYMINGIDARFRWFDATLPGFVVTPLPAGSYSLRCALDDKRASQSPASDIILTYLRDGTLYFRAQRDRYQVEYPLRSGLASYVIGQFGMNRVWRMQWQLVPASPQPVPTLTDIIPDTAAEGSAGLTLTVTGNGFTPQSRVRWDGAARQTTYASATQLQALIPASDLLAPGEHVVTVANPLPGGGVSNSLPFTVVGTFLRLTEAGDVRITEAGDRRVLEH